MVGKRDKVPLSGEYIIKKIVFFINIILMFMIANVHLKIRGLGLFECSMMVLGVFVSVFIIKKIFVEFRYATLLLYGVLFIVFLFFSLDIMNKFFYINESMYFMYDNMKKNGSLNYEEFRMSLMTFNIIGMLLIYKITYVKKGRVFYLVNFAFALYVYFSGGFEIIEKTIVLWCFVGLMYFMMDKMPKYNEELGKFEVFGIAGFMVQIALIISIGIWFVPNNIYGHEFFGIHGMFENQYAPANGTMVEYSEVFRYSDGNVDGKKKLGGPINQRQEELLYLEGGYYKYLKAASRSSYDGEYWFNKIAEFEKLKKNILYKDDFEKYNVKEQGDLKISYSDEMKTKSVFLPGLVSEFDIHSKLYYSKESDSILKGDLSINEYEVKKIKLEDVDTAMEIKENFDEIRKKDSWIFTYSEQKQVEEGYAEYLKLPEGYSGRVKLLTNKIIKGCKTPYEKIRAIRKYLKDNYPYTLEVEEVPDGEDFVEYFLFEEKKGYCTYFASAMAVMGRVAGVPTRYTEGFMVHEESVAEKNSYDKKYVVKGTNAHAWTEVLLDHEEDLWVVVDATSEYEEEIEEINDEEVVSASGNSEEERDLSLNIGDRRGLRDKRDDEEEAVKDESQTSKGKKKKFGFTFDFEFGPDTLIKIIFWIILAKFVLYKRMQKINDPGKLFKYAVKRLAWARIYRGKNETEKEFVQRMEDENLKNTLDRMIYCAYERSYGMYKHYYSKEDFNTINSFVKGELSLVRYLIMKMWLY